MIVLKANQEQYTQLEGYENGACRLVFQTDGNGNYVVGKQVLEDKSFAQIKPILLGLEEIEYVPPITNN